MSQILKNVKLYIFLLFSLAVVLAWSFIDCFDMFTWFLEALPVLIGAAVLLITYRRFRFTNMAYVLIWIHAIILLIGAHYTYTREPLFAWVKDEFALSRNYYDRVGHFAQGFVPAIIAREILLRKSPLQKGKWLFAIVVAFCLAISAAFELFEFLVAVLSGDSSTAYLATQGDEWDTQKDMALCLIGAVVSLLTLAGLHDRALEKIRIS
jgi:putative membrane protein